MLNRYFPFDAIERWWWLLIVGPAAGLIFSLVTGVKPLRQGPKQIVVAEGPPSDIDISVFDLIQDLRWKENVLFAMLGFLAVCAVIWLLEELRARKQHISE